MTTKLLIISYIPYWNAEQKVLKKLAELVRVTIHNRKPTPIIIQDRTRQKHRLAAYAPYASAAYVSFRENDFLLHQTHWGSCLEHIFNITLFGTREMGRAEMNEDVFATGLRYLQPPSLIRLYFLKKAVFVICMLGRVALWMFLTFPGSKKAKLAKRQNKG